MEETKAKEEKVNWLSCILGVTGVLLAGVLIFCCGEEILDVVVDTTTYDQPFD